MASVSIPPWFLVPHPVAAMTHWGKTMTAPSASSSFKKAVFILVLAILPIPGCEGSGSPVISFPAAETPILETILDVDNNLIAPFHASGAFTIQPGRRLELRLRAIWPSDIQLRIDNQTLPEVKDSATHPELDPSGYFRISDVRPVHTSDPRFFSRVLVVLPLAKRGNVDFMLTVHDISQNPNLTGPSKEAPELQIMVSRSPLQSPRPSSLFFDAPDAKHNKNGLDSAFIADNVTLAGWLVVTPVRGLADPLTEDWHYDIWLDNDFIERNYSATTRPVAAAIMPGRWYTQFDNIFNPNLKMSLTRGRQPDAATFLMPGTDLMTVELNAWHKSRHNNQVPAGWVADPDPGSWPDVFWPFSVMKPAGISAAEPELQEGDYVIITGALVEDSAHLHPAAGEEDDEYYRHQCWFDTYKGHGGWLEIHPVDSIRRVLKKQEPTVRVTPKVFNLCRKNSTGTPFSKNVYLAPVPSTPPSPNSVLRFREIIDDRFTDMSTVDQHVAEITSYNPSALRVFVSVKANEGHFKATYLLWWEEGSGPQATAAPGPAGVALPQLESLPLCSYSRHLPQCDPEP